MIMFSLGFNKRTNVLIKSDLDGFGVIMSKETLFFLLLFHNWRHIRIHKQALCHRAIIPLYSFPAGSVTPVCCLAITKHFIARSAQP